jgi:hypothetical protein
MRKRIAEFILIIILAGFTQVFANDQARIVYIAGSGNGKKYHVEDCRTLNNSRKVEITADEAQRRGYTPSGVCKPGE